ncbi:sensor histidine kinase [Streptomyces sp. NPDC048639]|uniref:sensor histidine kinase n=1 Tax=Streptomyces sp. NPDC048639 TaxID=3365581 RepID=UPI00372443CB
MRPIRRAGPKDGTAAALRRAGRRLAATPRRTVAGEIALVLAVCLPTFLMYPFFGGGSRLDATLWTLATAVVIPLRRWAPSVALLATVPLFTFEASGLAAVLVAFDAPRRISSGRSGTGPIPLPGLIALIPVVTVPATLLYLTAPGGIGGFGLAQLGAAALFTALFLVSCALTGAFVGQRQRLMLAMRERTAHLERANRLADSQARLQERARIAEEMHDILGHQLTLISLYAGGLELAVAGKAPEMSKEAELLRSTARNALEELRDILGVLRADTGPYEMGGDVGTRADIEELVDASRQGGIDVELDWRGHDLTDAELRVRCALHRVVREALTNVHKHAASTPVRVLVDVEEESVSAAVRNGPEPETATVRRLPGTGSGLVGLEERVGLLGGGFAAGPEPGGGFSVVAELPSRSRALDSAAADAPATTPAAPGATARG